MKKAFIIIACVAAMLAAGTSLKAQEVTITLMPGWTWISVPSTETMDFATALGSFTPAVGDRIKSQWGIATYRGNGEWRGQISEFYPGYGYMYYSARLVPVSVTFNAQQPSQQVVVTTDTPQFITAISVMGGGEVTTTDGTYIIVKGLCWAAHENPTTNDDFYEEAESGVGTFSISMTELNIATTYYVRAYAVTPDGTVYGDQKAFTTRDGIPTVTTDTVTSITGVTASCGGTVTDNGGLNVTARGVCWSTSQNPTLSDSHTTNGSGLGSFTSSITGLSLSTTYYVRAYASTSQGTAYGEEVSFTTRDGIPTVTTAEVTDIQGETATCGSNVTDNCGLTVIARGVCWSTSPNPTLDDSHTTNGSGDGSFSSSITGLTISTTYYVRAYATTSAGTGYGEEVSFTTRNGVPLLTTSGVTFIGSSIAECGGCISDDGGLSITERGVCWSVGHNPTLGDNHTTDGTGIGSFSSLLTGLSANTTYYVRAYATNIHVTVYGNEISFITTEGWTNGILPGAFSISTTQQVYFSQGNLQYIGSAATPYWKFADNQWDILGTTTGQNSTSQTVDRDLFGWGTSGYDHGANCYQPWSTSTIYSDYYAYGSYTYNLYDQTGQADWGYNPISNGGNQANQWRTLTQPEWAYVFNTRTTSSGIRYAKAKVNDMNGVILLPDDWSSDTYGLNNTNTYDASFCSNTISASQWNTLEQAGAVFLPAAGYRNGTSVDVVGSGGNYWSASYSSSNFARRVYFNDTFLNTGSYSSRYDGRSVRLVAPAEN